MDFDLFVPHFIQRLFFDSSCDDWWQPLRLTIIIVTHVTRSIMILLSVIAMINDSWSRSLSCSPCKELPHKSHPTGTFEDDFPFPKLGYVSSLMGTAFRASWCFVVATWASFRRRTPIFCICSANLPLKEAPNSNLLITFRCLKNWWLSLFWLEPEKFHNMIEAATKTQKWVTKFPKQKSNPRDLILTLWE